MGRQVVDRIADHRQLPVDGPELAVVLPDDQVVPVQVAVEQAERPVGHSRRPPRQRTGHAEYVGVDAEGLKQAGQRSPVTCVDPLTGERHEAAQEVPAGARPAGDRAAVDERHGDRRYPGQLAEERGQLVEFAAGERRSRRAERGQRHALDEPVHPGAVGPQPVHGRDALHAQ
ncbi:hypothetical protein GCM10022227_00880 [Streptomyces sedi]